MIWHASVPITPLFGLRIVLRSHFCPYYHSFRTQPGSVPAVLSLLPLYLDSESFCARGSVPITPLFGLSAVLCPRFCPYYHSFRTQRLSMPAVLSLLHLFSDSARLRARGSVCPITTLFGLEAFCARGSVRIILYSDSARLVSAVLSLLHLRKSSMHAVCL